MSFVPRPEQGGPGQDREDRGGGECDVTAGNEGLRGVVELNAGALLLLVVTGCSGADVVWLCCWVG